VSLVSSMTASAGLANGTITEAMAAKNAATPASTSASAANAKASERAVTATAIARLQVLGGRARCA
jgi:hypothetical protein